MAAISKITKAGHHGQHRKHKKHEGDITGSHVEHAKSSKSIHKRVRHAHIEDNHKTGRRLMKKAATTLTVLIAAAALSVSALGYNKDLKLGDKLIKSNLGDNPVKIVRSIDKLQKNGISVRVKRDKSDAKAFKSDIDYAKEGFIRKWVPVTAVKLAIRSDGAENALTDKYSAQIVKLSPTLLDANLDIDNSISKKIEDIGADIEVEAIDV